MSHHEEKNADRQHMANQAKHKMNEVAGNVQKQVGKMTGNREQELQGKMHEMEGAAGAKFDENERKMDRKMDR